jgi:GTP-binding protein HflX
MHDTKEREEIAIVAGLFIKGGDRERNMSYLEELAFLAETAGVVIADKVWQELASPQPGTLIGKGKIDEIKDLIEHHKANLIIFDNDLNSVQIRNLEEKLDVKVMDRAGVILDIFAKRAKSDEAKTQVELAQLQYLMPRLTRMWTHLSKQFGGMGTKGPGETQIEMDRRMIREKIDHLKKKLEQIDNRQQQTRKNRDSFVRYALVGYTNAGKSTVMKMLTDQDVYIEDELFATLDTTVRAVHLPKGDNALLSDTVGFIRKLPHHLVASFRSTLSEAREADFLLHVVDLSSADYEDQIETVNNTLKELDIPIKNITYLFNKVDLVEDKEIIAITREKYANSVFIAAKSGLGSNALFEELQKMHDTMAKDIKIFLPYSKTGLSGTIYDVGKDVQADSDEDGTTYSFKIMNSEEHKISKLEEYFV